MKRHGDSKCSETSRIICLHDLPVIKPDSAACYWRFGFHSTFLAVKESAGSWNFYIHMHVPIIFEPLFAFS
jgi:hypothetical protein